MLGISPGPVSTIELAARHGFQGVELLVRDLVEGDEDLASIAAWKADCGLLGGSWPLPVDWRGNADRYRRDLSRLPAYARAAAELGLDRTGTWVLPEVDDHTLLDQQPPDEAAFDWHLDRLDAIAAILEEFGHRLGLEAIGVSSFRSGRGRPFIHRIEALTPLVIALQDRGRAVGLTVDVFHLFSAGEDVSKAFLLGAEAIVSVHLSDLPEGDPVDLTSIRDDHRSLPRVAGAIPCADLLRLLDEASYTGPVFAEPSPGGGERFKIQRPPDEIDAIVRHAAESLRSIWPSRLPGNGE
jgi:sugar phosphate isomerase/epimerase